MSKMMTVSVTLRLEVDRETWAAVYGTGEDAAGVRADAKAYVAERIAVSAASRQYAITEVSAR